MSRTSCCRQVLVNNKHLIVSYDRVFRGQDWHLLQSIEVLALYDSPSGDRIYKPDRVLLNAATDAVFKIDREYLKTNQRVDAPGMD